MQYFFKNLSMVTTYSSLIMLIGINSDEQNGNIQASNKENDFSELCRCCMSKGDVNIFKITYEETQTIAELLEACFSTKISSQDFLPKNICQLCLDKITEFYTFSKSYERVQVTLQERINSIKDLKSEENVTDEDDKPLSEVYGKTIKIIQFKTKEHAKEFKNSCSDCGKTFEFITHLEKHCKETRHVFPRRYACNICLKKFLSNTRLNEHIRIHNKERPYECNECKMTFTLSSNLKRHKKRHSGEKSYFCQECGKGFIQKHTLTVHMRLHNGETPFVCEFCTKGYRTKPLLQQHMYKHKDIEKQTIKYQKYYLKYGKIKVECVECKKIITKSALYNHMKVQHGDGLKKFLCNLCGKTYATKMSLDVHMNVHTKKISYDCRVCGKTFTHQNYLKTHLLLHSGERPHCCDMCGKTFVQKTHLDRHMRTHSGAKPYRCTFCDRAFALNENLKVHVRIHTGETPHHCTVCGKGFFNSSSKKKHEANVHRMHKKEAA